MKEKTIKNTFLFIANNAGFFVIIIALMFGIWSNIGGIWYKYFLNPILVFIAATFIGTPLIEGLTRGFSYLSLFKSKGILGAIWINISTIIFLFIAFFILRFTFKMPIQFFSFFIAYIILAIIVAVADKRFEVAVERTKEFENLKLSKKNKNKR